MTQPPDLARLVADTNAQTLSDERVSLAGRRLGIAAALCAAAILVYTVLYRTIWIAESNPIGFTAALVGLVISVLAAAYLLSAERSASRVALVGVSYEIFLALSFGISETWAVSYEATSPQVSWSSVVIVLFPFLIPARPAVVLGASVVSAAMTPLAMAIVFGISGRAWPAPGVLASFILPPFVCAVLAWAPTRVLSELAAEVRQARRLGNYELTKRLGAGAMGEVWLATHRLLARPAAVKLIKPEVLGAKSPRARELLLRRFEREAQVTASLESPHTVELYDFGVSTDGALFYVMEMLHGLDLETLVERFGPLPSERVIHLLLQACDSLEDAHERGLIHRDVKPANLFVSRKGNMVDFVKLLDFGLVKRWNHDEDAAFAQSLKGSGATLGHTAAGQIVGTPAFLAPEAALGEAAVDRRADLYALGCVGYWMLTAQYVFAEESVMAMAIAHVTKQPLPPSQRIDRPIVAELEAVLLRCLEKDPQRRPSTAEELAQALRAVPLPEAWSRDRAVAWWREHQPVTA